MQRYSDLPVWHKAHSLALSIYRATAALPRHERDGLALQLRRAALSVSTSIVKGSTKAGEDVMRALDVAAASLAESEYLLVVCRDLGYLAGRVTDPLIGQVPRIAQMLLTLSSLATDVVRLESPLPELADPADLADLFLGSRGDSDESSAATLEGASPSARTAWPASSGTTDDQVDSLQARPAIARSSARARKACGARSRRSR